MQSWTERRGKVSNRFEKKEQVTMKLGIAKSLRSAALVGLFVLLAGSASAQSQDNGNEL